MEEQTKTRFFLVKLKTKIDNGKKIKIYLSKIYRFLAFLHQVAVLETKTRRGDDGAGKLGVQKRKPVFNNV